MIGIVLRYVRTSIALLLGAAFTSSAGILLAPSLAQAGTLRIALLAHAQVQGDAVLLADFMPPHVPSGLRAVAESISLGSAPQIGSTRTFSRATLAAALEDVRLSRESFLVPEFLTAHRAGHFLTQQIPPCFSWCARSSPATSMKQFASAWSPLAEPCKQK